MTIWCNGPFGAEALGLLYEGVKGHTLVVSEQAVASVLVAGKPDPALAEADIAFGQPDPEACIANPRIKWVSVTTAGYTRYDTERFKEAMRARGTLFTNASGVYSDPCAQHVLAMMLALGRQLLASYGTQLGDRSWPYGERRGASVLLTGQTVVFLGFGAIGRRLSELLKPFGMQIYALRRQVRSEPGVRIFPEEDLTRVLPLADHVVNLLPENDETRNYVNRRRLDCLKRGARFYNVGRGATVDQPALVEALQSGRLGAAYLDVMEPEPLPVDHPLWSTPNCYITPHSAGGEAHQDRIVVRHFLRNFSAYQRGEPLEDRIL